MLYLLAWVGPVETYTMSQGGMSKSSGVSAHSGDFENLSMQSPS